MKRPTTTRLRFGTAVQVAAAFAVTLPATVLVLGPLLGRPAALTAHWLLCGAVYAALLAPTVRRAVAAGGFVLLGGAGVATLGGVASPGVAAAPVVLVAALVGLARSVISYRVGLVRGLLVEATLGTAAVALAGLLSGPSALGAVAAAWGFWLVQSVYPLIPGPRARGGSGKDDDAFARAAARLESLLAEGTS